MARWPHGRDTSVQTTSRSTNNKRAWFGMRKILVEKMPSAMLTVIQKEKSFYDRIKRYRADPSTSSPQNPIPDYYGEKISSVKDYHRWLKDQRAFNLKKNKNIL